MVKVFVLDTNVLLNDPKAIEKFGEHIRVVPITVMEELDHHKKNENTGFVAREAARALIQLINGTKAGKDIPLRNGGILILDREPNNPNLKKKYASLDLSVPDNRIIMAGLRYKHDPKYPERVVIVTNDYNVQIKAHMFGLASEEYQAPTLIEGLEKVYVSPKVITVSEDDSSQYYGADGIPLDTEASNGDAVFASLDDEVLVPSIVRGRHMYYLGDTFSFRHINFHPRNVEQELAQKITMTQEVKVIVLSGMAGTGKTILSLAVALEKMLHSKGIIHIVRPTDQAGESLGYLPGNLDEKMGPYREAIENAYNILKDAQKKKVLSSFDTMCNDGGKIRLKPINFALGATYRGFVILDEAQNLSIGQMKLFLSRIGEGTKVIINGDIDQISDSSFLTKESSGLTHLLEKMRGQPFFSHVHLTQGERSEVATAAARLL